MNIVVGDKYELVYKIGRGKFGHVFSSVNLLSDDLCAVKVEDGCDGVLKKEAKIYRLLRGVKGVLKLHDYGKEGRFSYIVISLISKALCPPGPSDLVFLLPQLLHTLRHIHASGVVHCDLKPGNIVFTRSTAYIIDFGLSRYGEPMSEKTSKIIGSHAYCSENVLNLRPPREKDDVVSLVLSIATLTGNYSSPFIRGDLPKEFAELVNEIPSLDRDSLYDRTLDKLLIIIRKQG